MHSRPCDPGAPNHRECEVLVPAAQCHFRLSTDDFDMQISRTFGLTLLSRGPTVMINGVGRTQCGLRNV
jgi:hypothetical protein